MKKVSRKKDQSNLFKALAILGVILVIVYAAYKNGLLGYLFPHFKLAEASSASKGVNWHMGAWYNATSGISGYNWDGLRKDLNDMESGDVTWVRFSMNTNTQTTCDVSGQPAKFYTQLANELDARQMKGQVYLAIPGATTTTATPTEVSNYTNWVTTMVNCYKTRYHDWEIGNEPNLHYFWNIDENTTDDAAYARSVGYYITYLQAAYQAIKTADPAANVMLGGLSQWKDERFMDELTKQGAGQFFDTLAFHPYSDSGPDGVISELNTFKAKAAADPLMANKPIWIGEVGFTTTSASGPGYVTTEQIKADYLAQTYQKLFDNGITQYPIMWYDFDHDKCTNCGAGYGLIFTDRSTTAYTTTYQPAYYAMKNLWNASPTPTATPTPSIAPSPTSTPTVTPTPTPSDTTAPTVSITAPSASTVTRGTTVALSANASDNIRVTKVEFRVNGTLLCTDTASAYSCNWSVPNKPNTSYTIQARAFDAAGNVTAASKTVTSSR